MAGLLGTAATNTTPAVANPSGAPQATSAQITDTAKWQNTTDQTMQGQVQNIIANDSPLMQQARTTAQQGMNQRGLLNSSMADTAAQSAVLNAAMPIAQNDAQQASKVAGYNTDQTNQANTFNTTQANSMATQNLNTAANASLADKAQVNDMTKLNTQIQGQKDIAAQQATAAQNVAQIEAQYKDLTQGSASATTIVNKLQDAINAINLDKTMPADAKAAAISDARVNAAEALSLIGALAGDLSLGNFINTIGV